MDPPAKPSSSSSPLFQVYLRLRPPPSPLIQLTQQSLYPLLPPPERYLTVEPTSQDGQEHLPTHITLHPPSDSKKRAVEKFAFTKVFEEEASQMDLFKGTGAIPLVEGVLGECRDGLLATLGVTGSGKSHTILGSRSQRGLTQLSLDLVFRSLDKQTLHPSTDPTLVASLTAVDPSEAQILSAANFLDGVYGDGPQERNNSRAQTPMMVGSNPSSSASYTSNGPHSQWSILGHSDVVAPHPPCASGGENTVRSIHPEGKTARPRSMAPPSLLPFWNTPRLTRVEAKTRYGNLLQDSTIVSSVSKRNVPQRPSALPQCPDISSISVQPNANTDYSILVSMYEVYNDRIFDLLSHPRNLKDIRRRPLLFKSTETSPDRKLVAGLRKIVCGSYEEALMVLETGLMERRVAGTGSNSVSSRSHGFFCVEVKQRPTGGMSASWRGAQLTIVDLAGSERARNAKTAGATLAEAGKINESLMYLGQCLQMQSDCQDGSKPSLVPFRQCKLTELLFSNSFPPSTHHANPHHHHRNAQKAIMIVTADPLGDFNATSQILRYSALAREVTVPRIPSISSTILAGTVANHDSQRLQTSSQPSPTSSTADETMVEMAFAEIARLSEEVEVLRVKLNEEEERRREAEEGWQRAEEKTEGIEQETREECWGEMERRLEEERRRWISAWAEEADRNDEHMDRKLEILTQSIQVYEDDVSSDRKTIDLTTENKSLRYKIETLERDLRAQSPSWSRSAKNYHYRHRDDCGDWDDEVLGLGEEEEEEEEVKTAREGVKNAREGVKTAREDDGTTTLFKLKALGIGSENLGCASPGGGKTPGRKVRKLTTRKWDLGDENEIEI